jgi:RimJ/RimL family protein N-acetyltransferase
MTLYGTGWSCNSAHSEAFVTDGQCISVNTQLNQLQPGLRLADHCLEIHLLGFEPENAAVSLAARLSRAIINKMELESPRLLLRRWRPADRASFAAINAEPDVQRYLAPMTREQSDAILDRVDAHFAQHGWGYWALEERESRALIGLCGLMPTTFEAFFTPAVEIGWRLSRRWQGKGFAREAAEAALEFAFNTLALDRVVSFTVKANAASWGLMERLGMHKLGEFDNPSLPDEHPLRRNVVYEIAISDFVPP